MKPRSLANWLRGRLPQRDAERRPKLADPANLHGAKFDRDAAQRSPGRVHAAQVAFGQVRPFEVGVGQPLALRVHGDEPRLAEVAAVVVVPGKNCRSRVAVSRRQTITISPPPHSPLAKGNVAGCTSAGSPPGINNSSLIPVPGSEAGLVTGRFDRMSIRRTSSGCRAGRRAPPSPGRYHAVHAQPASPPVHRCSAERRPERRGWCRAPGQRDHEAGSCPHCRAVIDQERSFPPIRRSYARMCWRGFVP